MRGTVKRPRYTVVMKVKTINSTHPDAQAVRAWARERGIEFPSRGPVSHQLVGLFQAEPSKVRAWARQQGLRISDRGRLPNQVLEAYLAQPSLVREWARKNGKAVATRGRIPDAVVQAYLKPYRKLTRGAA